MNAPKLRPAVLRPKHLKPSLARAQRLATDRAQLTHEQLADATGTDRPHVSRWGHMHEPHAPSVLHVAAGPRAWALELIRWQAAAHGAQVLLDAAVLHADNHVARIAAVADQAADVPREIARALEDGELSTLDLEAIEHEALELADAALEAAAWARRTIERGRPR